MDMVLLIVLNRPAMRLTSVLPGCAPREVGYAPSVTVRAMRSPASRRVARLRLEDAVKSPLGSLHMGQAGTDGAANDRKCVRSSSFRQ